MKLGTLNPAQRLRISTFPGLWLNLLAIIVATSVTLLNYHQEARQQIEKCSAVTNSVNDLLSQFLASARSEHDTADQIREKLHLLLHEHPWVVLQRQIPEEEMEGPDDITHVEFLDGLKIPDQVHRANVTDKDRLVKFFASSLNDYYQTHSLFLKNARVYYAWIISAAIYAVLVCFGYFGNALTPENTEPLLNVIDIGLFLALVEFSGGLRSPVAKLLSFSIAVAGFELIHALHHFGLPSRAKWKLLGTKSVAAYVPSALYFFVLFTGLAWASIHEARDHHLLLGTYMEDYLTVVFWLLLFAASILFFVYLVNTLISRVGQIRRPFTPID